MADINIPDEIIFPDPENQKEEDLYNTLQDNHKNIVNTLSAFENIEAIAAGDALTDTSNTFAVNVDNITIEIASDNLQVKDDSIGTSQLVDDSVDKDKINADIAGDGLSQNVSGALDVNVDGTTITTSGDALVRANLTGDVTTSGNVTTIGSKVVDLSMMADGTDGELITYDASGVATTVSVGTDGQVLTSNGAGSPPTFEDNSGSAIEVAQASGTFTTATSSNITQTISEGDVFKFIWEGEVSGGVFTNPNIRINADGAGTDYEVLLNSLNRTASSSTTNTTIAKSNEPDLPLLDEATDADLPYGNNYGCFYLEAIITVRGSDTQISWELSAYGDETSTNSLVKTSGVGYYKSGTPTAVGFYRGSGTSTMSGRYYAQKLSQS